ncbi:MAG: hypothetical protein R3E39_26365 [Anaerolineae bacterium]
MSSTQLLLNPFLRDDVRSKAELIDWFSEAGYFSLSPQASKVIRTFLEYVADHYLNGVSLVDSYILAIHEHSSISLPPQFPTADDGHPLFPRMLAVMGVSQGVMEVANKLYRTLDPFYTQKSLL